MSDPIGQNSYKGLGVPLFGESVIRQQNSSNAILTLMHSTHNTGRLLMGMKNKGEGIPNFGDGTSHITDLAVFDIDAAGGFRALSGTTIKMELNSSGLGAVGDKSIFSASGATAFAMKRRVDITSNSTTINTSDAGKMYMISTGTHSSIILKLPTSAATGLDKGAYWDIYSNTTAAGVIDIAALGAQTGDATSQRIICHIGSTNAVETSGAITNQSSGPFWVRVMCITSGSDPVFLVSNMMQKQDLTSGEYLGISAGSTALT